MQLHMSMHYMGLLSCEHLDLRKTGPAFKSVCNLADASGDNDIVEDSVCMLCNNVSLDDILKHFALLKWNLHIFYGSMQDLKPLIKTLQYCWTCNSLV